MDRYTIAATAAMDLIAHRKWESAAMADLGALDREIRAQLIHYADAAMAGREAARALYATSAGPDAIHYEVGPDGEARRLSFTIKCF
jgi:hypothetical protein